MCRISFADELHRRSRVHTPLTEGRFDCTHRTGDRLELHDRNLILRHLCQARGIAHEVKWIKPTACLLTPEAPLFEELEHPFLFFLRRQVPLPIGVLLFAVAALPMLAPRCRTPRTGLAVLRQDRFIIGWTTEAMLERHATLDGVQFYVDLVFRITAAERFEDVVDPRTVRSFAPCRGVDHLVQRHLACGDLAGDQQVIVDALSNRVVVGEADTHAGAAAETLAITLTKLVTSLEPLGLHLALSCGHMVERGLGQRF